MEAVEKIMQKAENIRDVIRYLKRFSDATLVVHLDDEVFDSRLFNRHCRDLALLANSGIKLVIIAGAKRKIDKILTEYNHSWTYHNDVRITSHEAIPLIKMAAFDVSTGIMNALSAEKITGVIGNWVRARGVGVVDGTDFGSAGSVEAVFEHDLKAVIKEGFVPIFPCIGWSSTGRAYNISSKELTLTVATVLNADKIFFIKKDAFAISQNARFIFPEKYLPTSISLSQLEVLLENPIQKEFFQNARNQIFDDKISLNCKNLQAENFLSSDEPCEQSISFENSTKNSAQLVFSSDPKADTDKRNPYEFLQFLQNAREACKKGIKRVHFLNGSIEGVIPCEIFSEEGSGSFMVYSNQYGSFRKAEKSDISSMLAIMEPFMKKGVLLQRTSEMLEKQVDDFTVYDIDEEIRATAALHFYEEEKMAEIAALAVSAKYSGSGIGQDLVRFLIQKAKDENMKQVFILTTQAGDWFESQGFTFCNVKNLPAKRKELWSQKRASRMMILNL